MQLLRDRVEKTGPMSRKVVKVSRCNFSIGQLSSISSTLLDLLPVYLREGRLK